MPTTFAPPTHDHLSGSSPDTLPRRKIRHRYSRDTHSEFRQRWPLAEPRRDAIIGSTAGFLVSFAIAWLICGAIAYFFALWMIGPASG